MPAAVQTKLTPEQKNTLLLQWQAADKALKKQKEIEIKLREQVVEAYFTKSHDGVNNHDLGNGYVLKATFKDNYTLDKDTDKVDAAIAKMEKTGNEGTFLADRIISWKPSLSVAEYKKLTVKYQNIIDAVLTIKPGTTSLEIKEPNAPEYK